MVAVSKHRPVRKRPHCPSHQKPATTRELFNFKVIQTVSVDQGAKDGSAGGTPNTLFGAYFNCEGVSQLVCMNDADVLAAAATDMPEFDLAVVVVKDSKYGGAGGSVPCVSTDESAAEILRHELASAWLRRVAPARLGARALAARVRSRQAPELAVKCRA